MESDAPSRPEADRADPRLKLRRLQLVSSSGELTEAKLGAAQTIDLEASGCLPLVTDDVAEELALWHMAEATVPSPKAKSPPGKQAVASSPSGSAAGANEVVVVELKSVRRYSRCSSRPLKSW